MGSFWQHTNTEKKIKSTQIMPKRPTPPSTNMLLKKKSTSTKKATKKAKTKETKSIAPPSLPTPHESQSALITSGGDMLKEASSIVVVGELG